MIRLRKECPEIGYGDWEILRTGSYNVLAMRCDWRGSTVVTVHNFADYPREARIRVEGENADTLVSLLKEESSEGSDGVHVLPLDAHEYRWYRVGGLDYGVRRSRA